MIIVYTGEWVPENQPIPSERILCYLCSPEAEFRFLQRSYEAILLQTKFREVMPFGRKTLVYPVI